MKDVRLEMSESVAETLGAILSHKVDVPGDQLQRSNGAILTGQGHRGPFVVLCVVLNDMYGSLTEDPGTGRGGVRIGSDELV